MFMFTLPGRARRDTQPRGSRYFPIPPFIRISCRPAAGRSTSLGSAAERCGAEDARLCGTACQDKWRVSRERKRDSDSDRDRDREQERQRQRESSCTACTLPHGPSMHMMALTFSQSAILFWGKIALL